MISSDLSLEQTVGARLRESNARWSTLPEYESLDGTTVLEKMAMIALVYGEITGQSDHQEALEKSIRFVENAREMFKSDNPDSHFDWVFAVPARTGRSQGNEYASEITPFLPILDPKYGVDANIRQRTIVGLPPSIIETYKDDGGAIIYTPLHEDMAIDLDKIVAMGITSETITETARFARRLGAGIMGLGAVIPSITRFGTTINVEGLETTTGHGGTVFLLAETVKEVLETTRTTGKVGVIGASGSIGLSATDVMLSENYDFNVTKVFDKNEVKLGKKISENIAWEGIEIAKSAVEVLEDCDVVVSAINGTIDLDTLDPSRQLNLTGKIIVDDSQPGCFNRQQVEARGGKLVWVVGQEKIENPDDRRITRVGGYRFGETAGLDGDGLWGCEAEVAALALSKRYDLAVKGPVDSKIAESIGEVMRSYDISSAVPFQSFGNSVSIDEL